MANKNIIMISKLDDSLLAKLLKKYKIIKIKKINQTR